MLCSNSTPGNGRTIFFVDLCFQGSRPVSYLIQRETKTERQRQSKKERLRDLLLYLSGYIVQIVQQWLTHKRMAKKPQLLGPRDWMSQLS